MPGYRATMVEPVDRGLVCPHCTLLLRDPMQTEDGHRLCESCYREIAEHPGRKCRCCNVEVGRAHDFKDKAAKREINNLLVECVCTWQGKLQHLENHQHHCPHAVLHPHGRMCPLRVGHSRVRPVNWHFPGHHQLTWVHQPAQVSEQTGGHTEYVMPGLHPAVFSERLLQRNYHYNPNSIKHPIEESTIQRHGPSEIVTGVDRRQTPFRSRFYLLTVLQQQHRGIPQRRYSVHKLLLTILCVMQV